MGQLCGRVRREARHVEPSGLHSKAATVEGRVLYMRQCCHTIGGRILLQPGQVLISFGCCVVCMLFLAVPGTPENIEGMHCMYVDPGCAEPARGSAAHDMRQGGKHVF